MNISLNGISTTGNVTGLSLGDKYLRSVFPAAFQEPSSLEKAVNALLEYWDEETRWMSCNTSDHAAYQALIGLGEPALPFLLKALPTYGGHLHFALNRITGANPVPETSRGKIMEMGAAWRRWGIENGYLEEEK